MSQGDFEPIQQDQSLQSLHRLANQSRDKQKINRQTHNTITRLILGRESFNYNWPSKVEHIVFGRQTSVVCWEVAIWVKFHPSWKTIVYLTRVLLFLQSFGEKENFTAVMSQSVLFTFLYVLGWETFQSVRLLHLSYSRTYSNPRGSGAPSNQSGNWTSLESKNRVLHRLGSTAV